MTGGLIDDQQGGFRAGRMCVDHIFRLKQIGEKAREKKHRMYVGFIDLEKACDRINREVLSGIKSMYVDSSACFRVKLGEIEQFRIDNGVRQ